ncbi:hypothetical protein KO317_03975 [Candidatus Micrarchaeota archaeon]|nr:hypothetical protein [Candidatus Micrarchaeota archaeon]
MKMILGLLIIASLMLLGCTALENATTDLEEKAKTASQTEKEITPEVEEPILECEMKYWFDEDSTECRYKEFCGMYMYYGLRTFESLEDCEEELAESKTIISIDCDDMDETDKWVCLIKKAEETKNINVCNQIIPTDQRNTCIKTVSHILHDVNICNKLNSNDDQLLCRYHSSPQVTGGLT